MHVGVQSRSLLLLRMAGWRREAPITRLSFAGRCPTHSKLVRVMPKADYKMILDRRFRSSLLRMATLTFEWLKNLREAEAHLASNADSWGFRLKRPFDEDRLGKGKAEG
ncbi:hypothetical protein FOL47_008140 [Perkinsus chesapeaki]|uniref:Uncharacterized protein n=1 Tax=Perkinsus chesapeaki TaxID=330153 RepID=A0A7J6LFX2_PERCH|nr:hypothetical protein FOL47_008140 [Perkinsus chesapeaki]